MRDVKKLKGEPYKSGYKFLEDAMNVKSSKLQEDLINDARKAFTQATELEDAPSSARAAYQVGICYSMLKEPDNALRWYEKAFEISDSEWDKSLKRLYTLVDSGDRSDPRAIGLTLLTLSVIGAPLALYIDHRARKEKERLEIILREIDQFIPPLAEQLKSLNSKNESLKQCARSHIHKALDEYRQFERSDGNWVGRGH